MNLLETARLIKLRKFLRDTEDCFSVDWALVVAPADAEVLALVDAERWALILADTEARDARKASISSRPIDSIFSISSLLFIGTLPNIVTAITPVK